MCVCVCVCVCVCACVHVCVCVCVCVCVFGVKLQPLLHWLQLFMMITGGMDEGTDSFIIPAR